jgi:hypothetical protein
MIALAEVHQRLAFGCARIRGGMERKRSLRILEAAYDQGIRQFDTAPIYGDGLADSCLAEFVSGARGEFSIASKTGLARLRVHPARAAAKYFAQTLVGARLRRRLADIKTQRTLPVRSYGRFTPDFLKEQIAETLDILKTPYLDLLLLHEPPVLGVSPEYASTMDSLLKERLINGYGSGTGRGYYDLPRFGTVSQFYLWGQPLPDPEPSRRLIVHGLLRGLRSGSREHWLRAFQISQPRIDLSSYSDARLAGILSASILLTRDDITILFSASTPDRVREFTLAVNEGVDLMCSGVLSPVNVVASLDRGISLFLASTR